MACVNCGDPTNSYVGINDIDTPSCTERALAMDVDGNLIYVLLSSICAQCCGSVVSVTPMFTLSQGCSSAPSFSLQEGC